MESGSEASYIITHCHFLCRGNSEYEKPGSLLEASKFVLFLLHHSPLGGELVAGFTVTDTNKFKRPKEKSFIARLSHE